MANNTNVITYKIYGAQTATKLCVDGEIRIHFGICLPRNDEKINHKTVFLKREKKNQEIKMLKLYTINTDTL